MKRKTKEQRQQFIRELNRIGISEFIFSNWNTGRTDIPDVYIKNEREFLNKYLTNIVTRRRYL